MQWLFIAVFWYCKNPFDVCKGLHDKKLPPKRIKGNQAAGNHPSEFCEGSRSAHQFAPGVCGFQYFLVLTWSFFIPCCHNYHFWFDSLWLSRSCDWIPLLLETLIAGFTYWFLFSTFIFTPCFDLCTGLKPSFTTDSTHPPPCPVIGEYTAL